MTWVTANKGAGPWPFTPQPEKCGYVNNPRWKATPASDVIHDPCGYWPKGVALPMPANLYGLTTFGGELWAAYFDGDSLSWVGSYDSPIDANGLAFYNGNLITVAGTGATAVIREVSSSPPIAVVTDHSVLLADDLPGIDAHTTILHAPDIDKYFIVGGGVNGRIVRLSKTLAREARGVYATVTTGTDGHLYFKHSFNFNTWYEPAHPVTGASWTTHWTRIPDDVCDSPISTWGDGSVFTTYSGIASAIYYEGFLYVSIGQSVAVKALRKIDPLTLEIVASQDLLYAGKITAYGGFVYVCQGATSARVKAYRASDLVEVADSGLLPYGRFISGVGNGDLAVINGRLIATTVPYVDNSALYALDMNSLAVLEVVPYNVGAGGPIYPCLARIDDKAAVIAEDNGVGVAYLNGLQVPSGKTAFLEEASPPYLGFGKYGYTGFGQQWVLAQPASSAPSPLSQRCGTSPVWPMPA